MNCVSTSSVARPRLKARMSESVRRFLAQPALVRSLVNGHGSPLNVMFPKQIRENIDSFNAVFTKHKLAGKVFFTTKPNKSLAVKREAALAPILADVSSFKGLLKTIEAGFSPRRIEATGPKNMEYLGLALQLGVIINIDNFTEFHQVIELRKTLGTRERTRVFLRLGGFFSSRISFTKQDGTFGVSPNEASIAVDLFLKHREELQFLGFSYYVSGASNEQRNAVLNQALELTMYARQRGLEPLGLDIGGGFHVQYADSREEWDQYVGEIKRSVLGERPEMTWNSSGLGFRQEKGKIAGAANFMDHYTGSFVADDFEKTIVSPLPDFGGHSAVQVMNDAGLELFIEPGRALLDQVGISLARVNHVKRSTQGNVLVNLDMNRSNVHSTHQKLLTEPVIIPCDDGPRGAADEGVYYNGNLCVSYDIIQYNKTFPDFLPNPGDLVAFINTGPYIMDFIESETLHQRVADRVAVVEGPAGFECVKDENYFPWMHGVVR